jgi:uncharacterized protein with HEPN domain
MRPEERDPAYLWDMIEAARAAVDYTENLTLDKFLATDRERAIKRLAVERQLEILGEAARRVSSQFQEAHPELPWREMVGLRNVISHDYDKVNYESIFRIVRNRLPVLIAMLEPLVPPLPPEEP